MEVGNRLTGVEQHQPNPLLGFMDRSYNTQTVFQGRTFLMSIKHVSFTHCTGICGFGFLSELVVGPGGVELSVHGSLTINIRNMGGVHGVCG